MRTFNLLFALLALTFSMGSASAQETVEHLGYEYQTVQMDGRTWLSTNIKLPVDDGTAEGLAHQLADHCDGETQPVPSGKRKGPNTSIFWTHNPDYDQAFVTVFDGDSGSGSHGAIFNYTALEKCNVCPSGYRLPTADEFKSMAKAIGGKELVKKKSEDWGAIGRVDSYGSVVRGRFGEYWTSTPDPANDKKAMAFVLMSNGTYNISSDDKRTGCYVRCIKEEEDASDLEKRNFEMLAHSIHGGKEKGQWFAGFANADKDKEQIRVIIVKKTDSGAQTLKGEPATILNIETLDEKNHALGGHLYVFRVKNLSNEHFLAVGPDGDKNVYIRHKSTATAETALEFAFRSHNPLSTDAAGDFGSFESVVHSGYYLRHAYHAMSVSKFEDTKLFRADATWKLVTPE